MKLFQWVHRKLRQNSIDPLKDFTLGNPCTCLTAQPTLDNQYSNTKPSFSSINQPSFRENALCSYSGVDDNGEHKSQETPAVISELFEGFLTIGTLGAETVTNEPATPTFAMPFEDITMNNAKVTENDLKLISYELEKFLEAEKEETFYESSGRNSHVSTIILSGKHIVGSEAEDYANKAVCPLQGYLLGSSIELPETEVKKERASLGELFHRTKATSQECAETGLKGEAQVKQTQKSAMHIMRKILKKVHISSKSCNTPGDDADSASTNKKLHKVLRMFHRKVYPENTINAKDFIKSNKDKIKDVPHDCCHEHDDGDPTNPDKGRRYQSDTKSRKWSQHCETNCIPPQHGLSCSTSPQRPMLINKALNINYNGSNSSLRLPPISILHDRSTRFENSLKSWLTTSTVSSFLRCFKSFTTSARAFQSSPARGSSNISRSGICTNCIAKARRRL